MLNKPQHRNIGRKFRLIGRTTEFTVMTEYDAAGFIRTLVGLSEDGKFHTQPRAVDVVWLS